MGILDGKKALVFGVADKHSIAYGIAKQIVAEGGELALSYAGPALEKRVKPIAEELGVSFVEECDLSNDEAIEALVKKYEEKFGKVDILVHSVAFAPRDALSGRFMDVTRNDFLLSMNISVYTLVAIARAFEPLMNENASMLAMTYYGSEKAVPNYNVMGVAKAALESTIRYLAVDLGKKGIRVNAISAGPVKTLSAAGIAGFRNMLSDAEKRNPLQRNIDIDDVGNMAAFLLSDKAKNTTGHIAFVDAGFNITTL